MNNSKTQTITVMSIKKQEEYALKIGSQLEAMFKKGAKNHINPKELENKENMKDFLHALANVAPTVFYNKVTNATLTTLEFNHIANHLLFDLKTEK